MNLYQGSAIAKENIGDLVKKGDGGMLTAYLPEQETFAVYFGEKKWFTFKETEESFLERFEVVKDDA